MKNQNIHTISECCDKWNYECQALSPRGQRWLTLGLMIPKLPVCRLDAPDSTACVFIVHVHSSFSLTTEVLPRGFARDLNHFRARCTIDIERRTVPESGTACSLNCHNNYKHHPVETARPWRWSIVIDSITGFGKVHCGKKRENGDSCWIGATKRGTLNFCAPNCEDIWGSFCQMWAVCVVSVANVGCNEIRLEGKRLQLNNSLLWLPIFWFNFKPFIC